MLKIYSWFACPTVVEMVLPNLQGAAAKAAISLTAFLEALNTETGQDLRSFDIGKKTANALQNDEQLLWRFERMRVMLAALGSEQAADHLSNLSRKIWTKEQRHKAWANQPDAQALGSTLYETIQYAQTMDM